MYAVPVSIFGGLFLRNHNNGADEKLHSLQKIIFSLFIVIFACVLPNTIVQTDRTNLLLKILELKSHIETPPNFY